jgi:hypothetical protein
MRETLNLIQMMCRCGAEVCSLLGLFGLEIGGQNQKSNRARACLLGLIAASLLLGQSVFAQKVRAQEITLQDLQKLQKLFAGDISSRRLQVLRMLQSLCVPKTPSALKILVFTRSGQRYSTTVSSL